MSKSNAAKRGARLLALALVLRCGSAAASPPHMVKDINEAPVVGPADLLLGEAGELFYFAARGYLYRSDGTAAGTYPLRLAGGLSPACTASLGPIFFVCGGLTRTDGTLAGTALLMPEQGPLGRLARLGGHVYFDATNFQASRLGRTDGTVSGTAIVKDYMATGFGIPNIHATTDRIYFTAYENGREDLFVYDGGPAPPASLGPFSFSEGLAVGNRFFFLTTSADYSTLLWETTGGAPTLLRTFSPMYSRPSWLTALGGLLLFQAENEFGREPWISDGTVAGTTMLLEVVPGFAAPVEMDFEVLGGTAFFLLGGDLWKTDGTPAGTTIAVGGLGFEAMVAADTKLLLSGNTSSVPSLTRLWASDGTPGGTRPLRSSPGESGVTKGAIEVGGRIHFPYFTQQYGYEIWSTDGSAAGTRILADLDTRTLGVGLSVMVAGTTRAYFHQRAQGLWSTDGTEAGTLPVTKNGVQLAGGDATTLLVSGDTAFACGSNGLWRTDGTEAGTSLIATDDLGCSLPVWSGSQIFFMLRNSASGYSLWKSDGTAGNATLVGALNVEPWGASAFGSGILFVGHRSDTGAELWTSDGTAAGTRLVEDIVPGPESGIFFPPLAAGAVAFFRGGPARDDLWRTDGTEAGTFPVMPGGPTVVALAGEIGGTVYFVGRLPGESEALWRSDGTPQGTATVGSFSGVAAAVVSSGKVFFAMFGSPHPGLWVSDGTEAGTLPVTAASFPSELTAVAGGLAYSANGAPSFTDGTNEGTREISGMSAQSPETFVRLGSMLLFSADELIHGRELWRADLVDTGRMFYTVTPCRVVDTRMEADAPALLEDVSRDFQVAGLCGIPADAAGVVLNVTGTQSTIDGYFEAGPAERYGVGARSTAFRVGQTRASWLTLGFDPASTGRVTLKLNLRDDIPAVFPPSGHADVILDVSGYFR